MKKIVIALGIIIALAIAYYLISPLFITVEVNDQLPENITSEQTITETATMPSGFEKLSPEQQEEMNTLMEEMKDQEISMNENMPNPAVWLNNTFMVMGSIGHPAHGEVRVLSTQEGNILRYENFESINGPNLHVYLANDLEAKDYIDLGPIRGTKGNINYQVPAGIDVTDYKYVMYWCVPFGVLFNYAALNF